MKSFAPSSWLVGALLAISLSTQVSAANIEKKMVVEQYSTIVYSSYSDTLAAARDLQASINTFVAAPSEDSLLQTRKAWLEAREWYGQTEAFRFYGGPIDSDTGPEGMINAWPLDEAYIDSVKGKPKAGIVNNPKVKIDAATLRKLNERGGEENIATGWHAIEFLLWGQDFSKSSAGNRPYTDFTTAPNAERRRLYLQTVAAMLVEDLASVQKEWAPDNKDNYRAKFVAGGEASIRKILTGIGTLSRGELAGERIEVAMDTQNQEDEHSCFADNTHRDIVTNAKGIQNIWEGRYVTRDGKTLEGASLKALVAEKNADVAGKVSQQIAETVTLAGQIQAPFDQEIIGKKDAPGRKRVQAVIDALKAQTKALVEAAQALGIKRLNTSV